MFAVHAPRASLPRPASRRSLGAPARASPSVAVGVAKARSALAALRCAGRTGRRSSKPTRWTRASSADDARPKTSLPGREGDVLDASGPSGALADARAPSHPNRAFARFVFTAALSMFAFGVATGSVASALVFLDTASAASAASGTGPIVPALTTNAKAALVAMTPLGAVAGALAAPRAANASGRKKTLLRGAAAPYALGAFLCAFALTDRGATAFHLCLLVGRAMQGVGAGVSTGVTTMYVSECAPTASRGSAASLCPLFGTAGIVASYLIGACVAALVDARHMTPELAWRCALGSCAVPVLAQVALRDCLVESPRWLAAANREREARAAAGRLGGGLEAELFGERDDRDDRDERASVRSRRSSLSANASWRLTETRYRDLFATPETRAATRVAVAINAAQQFCGINAVVYFFPLVLAGDFGWKRATAMAFAAAVSAAQVAFGAVLARARVVDRFGRKPTALCGIAGLVVGLACLVAGVRGQNAPLAVAGVCAFRLAFAASLGPLPYVVAAEVYASSATRATGVALATATQWACNALVSGTFLPLVSNLGPTRVWLVYLAACVAALAAGARFAPETKDIRLE